jgi:hypothetical protein
MPTVADRLTAIIAALPAGSAVTLPADAVRMWLAEEPASASPEMSIAAAAPPADWRERLWTVPDAVRLGVPELAEALDRSPDWIYRAVNPKRAKQQGREPLPCRKLDGVLVFEAGAVRRWVQASESLVNPEPTTTRLCVMGRGR